MKKSNKELFQRPTLLYVCSMRMMLQCSETRSRLADPADRLQSLTPNASCGQSQSQAQHKFCCWYAQPLCVTVTNIDYLICDVAACLALRLLYRCCSGTYMFWPTRAQSQTVNLSPTYLLITSCRSQRRRAERNCLCRCQLSRASHGQWSCLTIDDTHYTLEQANRSVLVPDLGHLLRSAGSVDWCTFVESSAS